MKKYNEIEFMSEPKHKEGKYWKIVSWIILFLVVAFCFVEIYSAEMSAHAKTRQEAIRELYQRNGIPVQIPVVVYKNI